MKYTTATPGRVFIIRLEDGEIIHEVIEKLALDEKIQAASLIVVGGADKGSTLVVGPENGRAHPIVPMTHQLDGVHEVAGTGTLFPDENGQPVVHLHLACGRHSKSANTVTGCIREGVKVWQVLEVILYELVKTHAVRRYDPETGFKLLQPE